MRIIYFLMGLSALVACDDNTAVGPSPLPRDMMPDILKDPIPVDAEPVTRAHDAEIVDFGPPGDEVPPNRVAGAAAGFPGDVTFFARNLSTGISYSRNADQMVYVGRLLRIMPVLTYVRQVADDVLNPESTVTVGAEDLRAGRRLDVGDVGREVSLEALARWTLLDGDQTAEAMLVKAVGGSVSIESTRISLMLDGIGRYVPPCETDRQYAVALSEDFAQVDCADLARWIHQNDPSGIVPAPFAEAPIYTPEEVSAAWQAVAEAGALNASARGLGRLLARVDDLSALSDRTAYLFRNVLDRSLGSGGGGDELPTETWVGSIDTRVEKGRHWAGLVRGGRAPFVFVALTSNHERGAFSGVELITELSAQTYAGLVGAGGQWPPVAEPSPPSLLRVLLLDADAARACDARRDEGLDALLACRSQHARANFATGTVVGGTVFLQEPPRTDVAWFWGRPDGHRRRYQVRLDNGAWWVWTRSIPVLDAGSWQFALYVDGAPVYTQLFEVR